MATLGCTPFFSGIHVLTWLNVSQLCQRSVVHYVSSRLEVEERKICWRLPGGTRTSAKSQRKMHAQLSLSAMFVIMFMFWYSFFPLLST